jgi:hypothetical protein
VARKTSWVSVRTKNFSLIGNAGEKDFRKLLKLEQFREVFTRLFPKMRFNTPVPTTVIVFQGRDSYGPFSLAKHRRILSTGPTSTTLRSSTRSRRGTEDPFSVIFHEYTSPASSKTLSKEVPLWFNEGLAEYYSTFRISDDQKITLDAIGTTSSCCVKACCRCERCLKSITITALQRD